MSSAPAGSAVTAADARRLALLNAPIVPTLARLSAPNLLQVGAQAAVTIAETYFIGLIGTEALAGVALVFPLIMLMQMMSSGAMGGGIASAVARALGGQRRADAAALAWHALLIAVALGIASTLIILIVGASFYRLLGATGAVLENALTYSNFVFGGAILFWLMNSFASVLRGTGDMRTPALVIVVGGLIAIAISPPLIFGLGGQPGLGLPGAALAMLLYYGAGAAFLGWRLIARRAPIVLRPHRFQWTYARDILKVGLPACLHAILINAAVALTTGFVGEHGAAALAGYGIGARLEYLQIPIVFGFGTALVAMVGTNVGAGQLARARRIALTGGLVAGVVCGAIGMFVALVPNAWAGLFSSDPDVLAVAHRYLRIVGPSYAFLGFGMGVYFAFQGTGRMIWPMVCVGTRIGIIAIGCALAARTFALGLDALFLVTAAALIVFGLLYLVGMHRYFARTKAG